MSDNQDQGSNVLRDLSSAASRNPLSAALIGMGALWFLGDRAWQAGVRPTIDQASEVIGSAMSRARPEHSRRDDADDQWSLSRLFREQPLALGVIGAAIGAGLAAALPASPTENQLLGEASDELKAKAQEFAGTQASRAGEAAERALHAAAEEAEKQGLSPEGLKSAKDSVAEKLERVAEAAKGGAAERSKGAT